MSQQPSAITLVSPRELSMERTFNAPVATLWRAFTTAEQMERWWGQRANTMRVHALDFRPGGRYRFVETAPDGEEHAFRGEFLEIVPMERFTQTFEYEPWAGHIVTETITFEDLGEQTRIRSHSLFASQEDRDGMVESGMEGGALESYSKLDDLLFADLKAAAGDELVMTRTLEAPRALAFAACTEPEHLMQWWGPKGMTMKVAQMELRPGGTFLYGLATPSGQEMWGKFVYSDVAAPDRLAYVNSFSDAAGGITRHPLSDTWPLELQNLWLFADPGPNRTTLSMRAWPINATPEEIATVAGARAQVDAGMSGTFAQLDAYLATLMQPVTSHSE